MKRILLATILLLSAFVAGRVYAFDSSQAYNTITFSYIDNAYVKQTFVLSSAQQSSATSFKLTVDAKDGGGRPTHNLDGTCSTYCTQYDTAQIQIIAYNASGSIVSTKSVSQDLMNWGSNAGWSAGPGDNQFDWAQMSVSVTAADVGGSFSNVARIEVRLVNQNEGSYWNGNYGVQFRTPTLQVDGTGENVLYNSEFGVDPTGIKAQGWQLSYSTYNSCSGNASSQVCVTQEQTVTANMWGGGYDPNGGTTSGTAGGYSSVLTSDNADTAATGGDISGGSSQPVDPNTTVVGTSSGMTAAQTTTKNNAQTRRDSYWGNNIYVDQVGDSNTITIKQESANNTVRGYANQTAEFHGNNNTIDIRQGAQGVPGKNLVELDYNGGLNNIKIYQDRYDDGSQDDNAYGNHVARASINGNSNTLSIIQRNNLSYPQGNYADISITGSSNNVSTLQISDVGKNAFVNIQGDSNVVNLTQRENSAHYADIKIQGNGHNVTLEQKGIGAHRANIDLTNNGASSTVNVLQQGTTQQSYSLQQTCVALPCGASIIQGQ